MVHSRGIHFPVASQKGAMPPDLSTIGVLEAPKSVPEVPREMTQLPSVTAPAPRALIWLSPLPGATMTSGERPSSSATSFFKVPTTWCSQRPLDKTETEMHGISACVSSNLQLQTSLLHLVQSAQERGWRGLSLLSAFCCGHTCDSGYQIVLCRLHPRPAVTLSITTLLVYKCSQPIAEMPDLTSATYLPVKYQLK